MRKRTRASHNALASTLHGQKQAWWGQWKDAPLRIIDFDLVFVACPCINGLICDSIRGKLLSEILYQLITLG
jgi:hypothetical protein